MTATTILDYAMVTSPDPLQITPEGETAAPTTITIVVSNNTKRFVQCSRIAIDIPFGSYAKDLTSEDLDTEQPAGWDFTKIGGQLTATPHSPQDGHIGPAGLTFGLFNVQVNGQPGTVSVTITEDTVDDSGNVATGTKTIDIVKGPRVRVLTFTGPSKPVFTGMQASLAWTTSTNTDHSVLMAGAQIADPEAPAEAQAYAVTPNEGETVYTLYAYSRDGTASVPKPVTVNAVSISVTATVLMDLAPWRIAASPDGTRVYATEWNQDHGWVRVAIIDTATNQVSSSEQVLGMNPGIAVSPDGAHVYVSGGDLACIYAMDVAARTMTKIALKGSVSAGEIAVNPRSGLLYVANHQAKTMAVVDAAKRQAIATIDVGTPSISVTFTPDGARAFVLGDHGSVSVIDAVQHTLLATVTLDNLDNSPLSAVVSPDGARVFVVRQDGRVSVIDVSTNKVDPISSQSRPIGGSSMAAALATSPDGALLFVTLYDSNCLGAIDAADLSILQTVPLQGGPFAITIVPGGRQGYVVNLDGRSFTTLGIPPYQ